MADIADAANELNDFTIQHALANRLPPLPFTGKCRYCEEKINTGSYCDEFCRDDDEKRMRNNHVR